MQKTTVATKIIFDENGRSQTLVASATETTLEFQFYIRQFRMGYEVCTEKYGVPLTGLLSLQDAIAVAALLQA